MSEWGGGESRRHKPSKMLRARHHFRNGVPTVVERDGGFGTGFQTGFSKSECEDPGDVVVAAAVSDPPTSFAKFAGVGYETTK